MTCQNCKKQIPRESVYCMFCGAPIFSADHEEGRGVRVQPVRRAPEEPRPLPRREPTPRFCGICGTSLPDGYDNDVCDACLFVRDINANLPEELPPAPVRPAKNFQLDLDLDTEYSNVRAPARPIPAAKPAAQKPAAQKPPRSTERKAAKWLLPVLLGIAAIIVLAVGALVALQLQGGDGGSGGGASVSEPSKDEAAVISYAQEMVKAAARDPKSVHFDRATVTVARDVSDYIVKQTFERADAAGKLTPGSYEAVLELVPADGKSYSPLLLKVDDETIYDYR